jgi:hypothetical protein
MKKIQRAYFILSILVLASLACQATSGIFATPTPTSTSTPVPPAATATRTPRPTATLTPTATPLVIRSESVRKMTSGGFNYAPLADFDRSFNNHEIYMTSPDESLTVLLTARTAYPGEHIDTALKYYLEYIQKQFKDVVTGDRLPITFQGAEGVTSDLSGTDNGKPFQARAMYLRPPKGKLLLIVVFAYGDGAWQAQGEKTYQEITGNISFFEIKPWSGCPLSTKPSYGTTKADPIKVGGELLNGPNLSEDYLSALLGSHGEVVSYYRVGSAEGGLVVLDEYTVVYGSQTRTLYIDIYAYEAPKAPTGMSCSGPFAKP